MKKEPHQQTALKSTGGITFLGLCASLGLVCATWTHWDAALGAGAGDFTWRIQEISAFNRVLLPLGWLTVIGISILRFRQVNGVRRTIWAVVCGSSVVGLLLSGYTYAAHENAILQWNANIPPTHWREAREGWLPWALARFRISQVLFGGFLVAVIFTRSAEKQNA